MPTSYRIDDQAGLAYFVASGTTTESEWVETRARLRADPRYLPGMSVLVDARRHESVPSTEFITSLASTPTARSGPGHIPTWAIVVSRTVSYGLGRMFSLLAEPKGLEVKVFRDIGDAESWLKDRRVLERSEPAEAYPPAQRVAT